VQLERQVEGDEVSAEVRVELTYSLAEHRAPALRADPVAVEQHSSQTGVGRDQAERPDRSVYDCTWHLVNLERAVEVTSEIRSDKLGTSAAPQQ
jgi:hypothetical protein